MANHTSSKALVALWLALFLMSVCLLANFVPTSCFLRHHPSKFTPVTIEPTQTVLELRSDEAPARILNNWVNHTPSLNASSLYNSLADQKNASQAPARILNNWVNHTPSLNASTLYNSLAESRFEFQKNASQVFAEADASLRASTHNRLSLRKTGAGKSEIRLTTTACAELLKKLEHARRESLFAGISLAVGTVGTIAEVGELGNHLHLAKLTHLQEDVIALAGAAHVLVDGYEAKTAVQEDLKEEYISVFTGFKITLALTNALVYGVGVLGGPPGVAAAHMFLVPLNAAMLVNAGVEFAGAMNDQHQASIDFFEDCPAGMEEERKYIHNLRLQLLNLEEHPDETPNGLSAWEEQFLLNGEENYDGAFSLRNYPDSGGGAQNYGGHDKNVLKARMRINPLLDTYLQQLGLTWKITANKANEDNPGEEYVGRIDAFISCYNKVTIPVHAKANEDVEQLPRAGHKAVNVQKRTAQRVNIQQTIPILVKWIRKLLDRHYDEVLENKDYQELTFDADFKEEERQCWITNFDRIIYERQDGRM